MHTTSQITGLQAYVQNLIDQSGGGGVTVQVLNMSNTHNNNSGSGSFKLNRTSNSIILSSCTFTFVATCKYSRWNETWGDTITYRRTSNATSYTLTNNGSSVSIFTNQSVIGSAGNPHRSTLNLSISLSNGYLRYTYSSSATGTASESTEISVDATCTFQ